MEALEGGRVGHIFKDGDTVVRPAGEWTPTVHRFLRHLHSRGLVCVPHPLGINEHGQEVVSYVPGRVCEDLADDIVGSDLILISAATLLREFHDASTGFLEADKERKCWMLPARQPSELVCHGDFAPYNVAVAKGRAVGLIDFDTAHPAPRMWDLAYAVYRWAPLSHPDGSGVSIDRAAQIRRARLFCAGYGATLDERQSLPDAICDRLRGLVDFVLASARKGNAQFVEDVESGHIDTYLKDIQYVTDHRDQLLGGLS